MTAKLRTEKPLSDKHSESKAKGKRRAPASKLPASLQATSRNIHELIAASEACTFDYRIGDLIQNESPHPSRTDLPIFGKVIRLTDESLVIHRTDADGRLHLDDGNIGGPQVDFVLKAAAKLVKRIQSIGKAHRVNLRDYLGDGGRWAKLKRSSEFVYANSAYMGLPASPLANPYATKGTSPEEAKSAYDGLVIKAALTNEVGLVWDELSGLADRLLNGEALTVGCWCPPGQPCHADSVIEGIETLAQQRLDAG